MLERNLWSSLIVRTTYRQRAMYIRAGGTGKRKLKAAETTNSYMYFTAHCGRLFVEF